MVPLGANCDLPSWLTKSADKAAVLSHQSADGDRAAQGKFLTVKQNVRVVNPYAVHVMSNEPDSGHIICPCACIVGVLKLAASELDCAGVRFPLEGKKVTTWSSGCPCDWISAGGHLDQDSDVRFEAIVFIGTTDYWT